MKKLTLIAMRDDEEKILHSLQKLGAVEIIPDSDEQDFFAREADTETSAAFDDELRTLDSAANILAPYAKKPNILTPLPEAKEADLECREVRQSAMATAKELHELSDNLRDIKSEIVKTEQQRAQLLPLCDFDIKLEDFAGTKHTRPICGYLPTESESAVTGSGIACEFVKSDKNTLFCIVYLHRSEADENLKFLASVGFTQYNVPELKGTANENCNRLAEQRKKLEMQADETVNKIKALSEKRNDLLLSVDAVNVEYDRYKAMQELLRSKFAFILRAWVCERDAENVKAAIEKETDGAYYIVFEDPKDDEEPPTVVRNPQPASAFESITNMYSRPAYRGLDASPQITLFYMLFFGMMLGDVGYGLLLFVGTLLFNRIKKPQGSMKKLVTMFMWSGLATMVCGVLFGSFFGMDIDSIVGTKGVFPLIMDPMQDVMPMLILCCGLGIVHMLYGMFLKMYMCIREKDFAAAIFDNLSWVLLIVGAIGAVLLPANLRTVGIIVALTGAALIVVFGGRKKKGIMKVFGGIGQLYNITGWLSDTVSYARVFAIGLVGGAMGQVFNMIGAMIGGAGHGAAHILFIVFAAVILTALHMFSLFINTLSAFAHTSRLQYVEFFGKFYEAGGREFKPLEVRTKNVMIRQ